MDLEVFILVKSGKDKYDITYMKRESEKMIKMNLYRK